MRATRLALVLEDSGADTVVVDAAGRERAAALLDAAAARSVRMVDLGRSQTAGPPPELETAGGTGEGSPNGDWSEATSSKTTGASRGTAASEGGG